LLLLFARGHAASEFFEIFFREKLASLREHLLFLFFYVVLNIFLHHFELGGPGLVGHGFASDLVHDEVHDVMLFVTFEHDVFQLGLLAEGRVDDLFFHQLVQAQLSLYLGEEIFTLLGGALGRVFQLLEHLLYFLVVFLQQLDNVHESSPLM